MASRTEPPPFELSERDVTALAEDLLEYHRQFKDLFFRREQAHWASKYPFSLSPGVAQRRGNCPPQEPHLGAKASWSLGRTPRSDYGDGKSGLLFSALLPKASERFGELPRQVADLASHSSAQASAAVEPRQPPGSRCAQRRPVCAGPTASIGDQVQ